MYHTIISLQMQLFGFTCTMCWLSVTTIFCTAHSHPMAYLYTGPRAPSLTFTQKMVTAMYGEELEQQ